DRGPGKGSRRVGGAEPSRGSRSRGPLRPRARCPIFGRPALVVRGRSRVAHPEVMMRVVVVGLGYVGSVCSGCLASRGHTVVGVDTSAFKVSCIEAGKSPIVEAGLEPLLAEARAAGRLCATTRIDEAIPGAEVVLLCVGTP